MKPYQRIQEHVARFEQYRIRKRAEEERLRNAYGARTRSRPKDTPATSPATSLGSPGPTTHRCQSVSDQDLLLSFWLGMESQRRLTSPSSRGILPRPTKKGSPVVTLSRGGIDPSENDLPRIFTNIEVATTDTDPGAIETWHDWIAQRVEEYWGDPTQEEPHITTTNVESGDIRD